MELVFITIACSIISILLTGIFLNNRNRKQMEGLRQLATLNEKTASELGLQNERLIKELDISKSKLEKNVEDFNFVKQDNAVKKASYDGLMQSKEEMRLSLETTNVDLQKRLHLLAEQKDSLSKEKLALAEAQASQITLNSALQKSKEETKQILEGKNNELQSRLKTLQQEKDILAERVATFVESEEQRKSGYERNVVAITTLREGIEKDREKEKLFREEAERQRLEFLKDTWSRHEKNIEEKMKQICQRRGIEYVGKEKYPYKGKPDNCVNICSELIIFDSKSPESDDLSNFPSYIKSQAESVKKYIAHDNVRKDIFLVIPTNAAESIETTFYDHGQYKVYVVTEDALEPILLTLKRIEDYEFADKLDPADREKIVTTLGNFAHGLKRRIQVDQFFGSHFITLLMQAESLPADILKGAQQVEKASKCNPPIEKRGKAIDLKEIHKDSLRLVEKAVGQGINTNGDFKLIDQIPLLKSDND